MTKISILLFALIVLLGPIYTVKGYSAISNLISELGAQKTENNYIMIVGFLILVIYIWSSKMILDFQYHEEKP